MIVLRDFGAYCICMFIRLLPLIAGLAPIIGANGAFWMGVYYDVFPSCFPYIDGCVSISASGRYPPGSFLFRAIQLPYATLLAIVWYFCLVWLRSIESADHRLRLNLMFGTGLIGSVALIVYVTFLGTSEPIYEFMRRGGIYFYFLSTTTAQVAASIAIVAAARVPARSRIRSTALWMLAISLAPFVLGLANLLQKEFLPYETADPIENQIEWIAATLMNIWFVLLYVVWTKCGFSIQPKSPHNAR